jgi:hypothetical protein
MQPPGEQISGAQYSLEQISIPPGQTDPCPGKKEKKLNNKQAAEKKKDT